MLVLRGVLYLFWGGFRATKYHQNIIQQNRRLDPPCSACHVQGRDLPWRAGYQLDCPHFTPQVLTIFSGKTQWFLGTTHCRNPPNMFFIDYFRKGVIYSGNPSPNGSVHRWKKTPCFSTSWRWGYEWISNEQRWEFSIHSILWIQYVCFEYR